jgi:hypothetical protein
VGSCSENERCDDCCPFEAFIMLSETSHVPGRMRFVSCLLFDRSIIFRHLPKYAVERWPV